MVKVNEQDCMKRFLDAYRRLDEADRVLVDGYIAALASGDREKGAQIMAQVKASRRGAGEVG